MDLAPALLDPPGEAEHEAERQGDKLRVLIIAHSHPELSKGGAEIAAQILYRGIVARPGYRAWFMGCDRRERRSDTAITQPFDNDDYLYSTGEFDWFKFANRDPRFPEAFTELLTELKPDIVHFHHYINVGVEAFLHVKRALPHAKIVVTLHEYLAICNHHGQMVTKPHRNLCYEGGPKKCIECFPEFDESDFTLRRRYVRHFFDMVDHFISPSAFLATRYVRWGLHESRISVIENLIRPVTSEPAPYVPSPNTALRAGFFGQLSFLKGVNILLEAARQLENLEQFDIAFEIFGDYRSQPPDFQKELLERLEKVGPNVRFRGPYDETRVDQLMQSVDVVVVPSVWWENSPLVIQEALRNRRPVICSDIGGMAEKIRDGIDGFHYHVGSATDLVAVLRRLADDRDLLRTLTETIRKPPQASEVVDAHLDLYRTVVAAGQSAAARPAAD